MFEAALRFINVLIIDLEGIAGLSYVNAFRTLFTPVAFNAFFNAFFCDVITLAT